jgi:hypothetical protein
MFATRVTDDYEDSSPGWETIDEQMARLYPDQEPRHYGTITPAIQKTHRRSASACSPLAERYISA